jgi:hypothetical protein
MKDTASRFINGNLCFSHMEDWEIVRATIDGKLPGTLT